MYRSNAMQETAQWYRLSMHACASRETETGTLFILTATIFFKSPHATPSRILENNGYGAYHTRVHDVGWDDAATSARREIYSHLSWPVLGFWSPWQARRYRDVFELAPACVSDTALEANEMQVYRQLALLNDDAAPDAHACRLRITLATQASQASAPLSQAPMLPCMTVSLIVYGLFENQGIMRYTSR